MSNTVRVKVTCPPLATVAGVGPGGEVELDPDEVNIKVLLKAGFVKLVQTSEKPAAKAADKK